MKQSAIKKFVSVLTMICLFLSVIKPTLATSITNDIEGHWAEETLKKWVEKGHLRGYGDGSIKPNAPVTRAEFVTLVNRAFDLKEKKEIKVADVAPSKWYYDEISIALQAGYLSGFEDNTIRPNQLITRQEVAVILARLLQFDLSQTADISNYIDSTEIPKWSKSAVAALVDKGIIKGYPDQTLRYKQNTTRAEAAIMIERALVVQAGKSAKLSTSYDHPGIYGPETGTHIMKGNVVINVQDVTLRNVSIQGDLILSEGIGEGDVTLQGISVQGQTLIHGGGANSIHFKDSTLKNVEVKKKNGAVRIVAEGRTTAAKITVHSPAIVDHSDMQGTQGFQQVTLTKQIQAGSSVSLIGNFNDIEHHPSSVQVDLHNGTVQKMRVTEGANDSKLKTSGGTNIVALEVNSRITVTGEGTIEKAIIKKGGAGTIFEKKPISLINEEVSANNSSQNSGGGGGPGHPPTVAAVAASIPAGEVPMRSEVTLRSATPGATIYYTVDGSNPTTSSMRYTDTTIITVDGNLTIKAIAVKAGYNHSPISTFEYIGVYHITGQIYDVDTSSGLNSTISAYSGYEAVGTPIKTAKTNAEGEYKLGIIPGIYTLKISSPEYLDVYYTLQVTGDLTRYSTLSKNNMVTGFVQGSEQTGLANAYVTLQFRNQYGYTTSMPVTTDLSGRYTFVLAQSMLNVGGEYTLRFNHTGYSSITTDTLVLEAGINQYPTVMMGQNTNPTATNLAIHGELVSNKHVTATYTYVDAENDAEGETIISWYLTDDQNGKNKRALDPGPYRFYHTLQLQPTYIGKYLSFEITPKAQTGENYAAPIFSGYFGPVLHYPPNPVLITLMKGSSLGTIGIVLPSNESNKMEYQINGSGEYMPITTNYVDNVVVEENDILSIRYQGKDGLAPSAPIEITIQASNINTGMVDLTGIITLGTSANTSSAYVTGTFGQIKENVQYKVNGGDYVTLPSHFKVFNIPVNIGDIITIRLVSASLVPLSNEFTYEVTEDNIARRIAPYIQLNAYIWGNDYYFIEMYRVNTDMEYRIGDGEYISIPYNNYELEGNFTGQKIYVRYKARKDGVNILQPASEDYEYNVESYEYLW